MSLLLEKPLFKALPFVLDLPVNSLLIHGGMMRQRVAFFGAKPARPFVLFFLAEYEEGRRKRLIYQQTLYLAFFMQQQSVNHTATSCVLFVMKMSEIGQLYGQYPMTIENDSSERQKYVNQELDNVNFLSFIPPSFCRTFDPRH